MTIAIRRPVPSRGRVDRPPSPAAGTDGWLDAVSKLIPGEAVLAHAALLRMPGIRDRAHADVATAVALTALVPVVLWWSARRAGTDAPLLQYVVRPGTFALFAVAHLSWVAAAGAIAIAALAALALVPPGAGGPPPP